MNERFKLQRISVSAWALVCVCAWPLPHAVAQTADTSGKSGTKAAARLPQRDITVELRQIEEGREGGSTYSAGSAPVQRWEPQMVQVRNGEKARLQMQDAIPMQWTESVSSQTSTLSAGGANASTQGGSVKQALHWFDAGQTVTVTPRWPGGNKDAVLEIEVQRAAMDTQSGNTLPAQSRASVNTTVTVPLAQWVTIAATGRGPAPNTYSSEAPHQVRRLLQVRVMAP